MTGEPRGKQDDGAETELEIMMIPLNPDCAVFFEESPVRFIFNSQYATAFSYLAHVSPVQSARFWCRKQLAAPALRTLAARHDSTIFSLV